MSQNSKRGQRVTMEGVVKELSSPKTIRVTIERRVKHPKYFKFYRIVSDFLAHDERAQAKVGDKVTLVLDRARSKQKTWRVTANKELSK